MGDRRVIWRMILAACPASKPWPAGFRTAELW